MTNITVNFKVKFKWYAKPYVFICCALGLSVNVKKICTVELLT